MGVAVASFVPASNDAGVESHVAVPNVWSATVFKSIGARNSDGGLKWRRIQLTRICKCSVKGNLLLTTF